MVTAAAACLLVFGGCTSAGSGAANSAGTSSGGTSTAPSPNSSTPAGTTADIPAVSASTTPPSGSAGASASGTTSTEEFFTPLIITPIAPDPIPVTGDDGKVHLVYELQVLNAAPRPATITEVDTLAGDASGPVVSTLTGDQVVAVSMIVGDYALPPVPARAIVPGGTLLLILDAVFDDIAAVPASVVHRLTATFGAFEPDQGDFAVNNFPARTVQVGGIVTTGKGKPERIGPPLAGPDWVAVNACCALSPHRGAMVPLGGRINGGERFAIDFSKFDLTARPIVDFTTNTQATFKGDKNKNESYFTFGQPTLAVADGVVVTVVDNLPEVPPHTFAKGLGVGDLGGNRIVLKIRDGVYAVYGHLMTKSISVRPGDSVKRGQVMGKVGNSGNTSESHLHFQLVDGPLPLTSTNIPWEIDSFTFLGEVDPKSVNTAGAGPRTNQLPLINSAIGFPEVNQP